MSKKKFSEQRKENLYKELSKEMANRVDLLRLISDAKMNMVNELRSRMCFSNTKKAA